MKKTRRSAKSQTVSAEEVAEVNALHDRFEHGERAWERMTAPVEDDPWTGVEESLQRRRQADAERGWKFFSK